MNGEKNVQHLIIMALDFNRILPLFVSSEGELDAIKLLRQILILKAKLAHPDQQSFYFRKGLVSNQLRLKTIIKNYNQEVELVNNHDTGFFKASIAAAGDEIMRTAIMTPIMFRMMHHGNLKSTIRHYEQILIIKEKYGFLKAFEEALADEAYLRRIFSIY